MGLVFWLSRRGPLGVGAAVLLVSAGVPGPSDNAGGAEPRDETRRLRAEDLGALAWRSVGPANMGGRVATIALAPGEPKTFYVGYATGGLWKTTNNGTTFTPVFDREATSSIGSVAVADAPADWAGWDDATPKSERAEKGRSKIVWVGTGEGNGRNSSSWGNGVYRSTDGGATFEHLGLSASHDIPAIAPDPRDPDVCYVSALGHLWGANPTRGVYRTTDGGRSWAHVLKIDDETGACDVVVNPGEPDTVYAAMYSRRRTPHSARSGGPEGGIYRSTDRGATWKKLSVGLPAQTGRIGLSVHAGDPRVVFAVIESDGGGLVGDSFTDRSRAGGVFRSDDAGDTWERRGDFNPRAFYFSRIRSDPKNVDRVYLLGWQIYVSDDGGRTFRAGFANVPHVDFHAMVIDPADTDRLLVGSDGGLYVSYDRGATWDFHNHMAVGQFYNVTVDDSDPYRIGGGLQDNGTWIGTGETIGVSEGGYMGRAGAITNADWRFVYGGDGFHVGFDPDDPDIIYAEWQGGHIARLHLDTGEHRDIRPQPKEGQARMRFNWNAPFFVSKHDPSMLYLGGNHVFRLLDRGDRWEMISPDLSARVPDQIVAVGSDAETAGTVVSLAESPVEAGLLWAGTDDGRVHVRRGASWEDVTPEAVGGLYVSDIEASVHNAGTAYVAVDGHRSDVFHPILLETTDAGATWVSVAGDLPAGGPVETIVEDPHNPHVLYAGTEHAAYVTIDCGEHWVRLNGKSLPTVPVDDLALQGREMDLVAGTHGRSIWVLDDVSVFSQMEDGVLDEQVHVFRPLPGKPRQHLSRGGLWGDRMFVAQNPALGSAITYWLREHGAEDVKITITNAHDHLVRTLAGTDRAGLNRVVWDLQAEAKQKLGNPHRMIEYVSPGVYTVKVTRGDVSAETKIEVLDGPGL